MKIDEGKKKTAIKAVIYGPEGIGKSTLASSLPNPLFLDLEEGTNQLNVKRVAERIDNWYKLSDVLDEIVEKRLCKTIVLDTADMAEIICKRYICKREGVTDLDRIGYHKGYYLLADEMQKMLNKLSRIVRDYHINVVFLAHSKTKKWELPDESGAYDRYELNLEKEVAPKLKQWADLLLFLNYRIDVVKTGDGFNQKYKAVGGKRVIYTTHSPTWDAKNRFGLPDELPLEYESIRTVFEDPLSVTGVDDPVFDEPSITFKTDGDIEVSDGDNRILISDEDADDPKLAGIVENPTVAKILSRLTENNLSESDATDFMKAHKIKPVQGDGSKIIHYDPVFLQRSVLDKWDKFKEGLIKKKGA